MENLTQEVLLLHANAENTQCSYLKSAKLFTPKYFILSVKKKKKRKKKKTQPAESQWRRYFSPLQNMKCAGSVLPTTTPGVPVPCIISTDYCPKLHWVGNWTNTL